MSNWYLTILETALTYGKIEVTQLEHDLAAMRKQLVALWEMCSNDPADKANQKIQKVAYSKSRESMT